MCSHIVQCMFKINPAIRGLSMVNGLLPAQRWRHWNFWQKSTHLKDTDSLSHPLYFKTLNQILTTNYIISTFCCWKWMFSLRFTFTYFLVHLSTLYEKSKLCLIVCFVRVMANPMKEGGIRKQWSNPCFLPWKFLKIMLLVSILLVAQPELCCFLKHSC